MIHLQKSISYIKENYFRIVGSGICALLIIFLTVVGAKAQTQQKFESLQVDIWPEYDRSSVLVIYSIKLSAQTSLPSQIILRIPRSAGDPQNVSMQGMDGLLYNLDYTTNVSGNWLEVIFTTLSPDIHFEYYDPRLIRDGETRNFEYSWPGDYSVEEMTIEMQQPINSEKMVIAPDAGMGRKGQDGLNYYTILVGSIDEGDSVNVSLSYQKADEILSQRLQPVQPVEPLTPQTLEWSTFLEFLPWTLGVLGLLLIVGGIFWYWQSGYQMPIQINRLRASNRHAGNLSPEGEATVVYCSECGKRAVQGDIFCRSCGTKLKQND